eukprot:749211-Hanusia_phi.AAC.3
MLACASCRRRTTGRTDLLTSSSCIDVQKSYFSQDSYPGSPPWMIELRSLARISLNLDPYFHEAVGR